MVLKHPIGGNICLKFQTSNFGNKMTSPNWKLLCTINIFIELRDFSASHCAKEFASVFNLNNIFTVEETEAQLSVQDPIALKCYVQNWSLIGVMPLSGVLTSDQFCLTPARHQVQVNLLHGLRNSRHTAEKSIFL